MPDQMVDVGGYRLSISITGSGTPPVILLAAAGGAHEMWESIAPQIAELSTCATYGRAGLGGSDPLPEAAERPPAGFEPAAAELRALLQAADLQPPHVFVTCSLGAYLAEQYARTWPDEVAGEVLLDPTGLSAWPPEVNALRDVTDDADGAGHHVDWDTAMAEAGGPRSRSVPTVVISSDPGRWRRWPPPPPYEWWLPLTLEEVDRIWQEQQREWAQHLSAAHIVTRHAGHFVHVDAPELVLGVLAAVLTAARRGDPVVELDPETVSVAGGDLVRQQADL